jgi:isopentenyl-diphosphate Delta-isomerase
MDDSPILPSRKADHIRINLDEDVRSAIQTGLDEYHFIHRALPEINLTEIDMSQTFFGKTIKAPILVSSMTGGTGQAQVINQRLAEAAEAAGLAMGVGSQRAGLEHPELVPSFQVRKVAPTLLLFANLGAVQLNYTYTIDHCRRAVEMIGADALILHLNPLQEALQPEGDTRFAGLLKKIESVCRQLPVPVIIKEVGWGISDIDAHRLVEAGVSAIDVAGAGGTSWSQVEMYRTQDEHLARVAAAFSTWGIPTAESIQMVRRAAPRLPIIASGGLRSGIDIAKCIAMGAKLGGMAGPFLKAAVQSVEEVSAVIAEIRREIQICMFACGVRNLTALSEVELLHSGEK